MAYLTWMADVLRDAGLRVEEVDGWQSRGFRGGVRDIRGVLLHHTVGPPSGNFPSLGFILRGDPPEKPPPLANLGLARDGTWYTIAAGLANHAGRGKLPGFPTNDGNPYLIGVEAESTGDEAGDWTPEQLESYPRGVAALLRHLGLPAERAFAHKEWALPKGRKSDPAGWPGDIDGFRDTVRAYLEDDMPLSDDDIYRIWDFKAHQLNHPEVVYSTAQWLVGANEAAWKAADAQRELVGLRAAVEKLAEAVGTAQGVNADDLKKAISDAIAQSAPPVAQVAPGNGEG